MATDKLPKYWMIENKYQEVRDFMAEKYNEPDIKGWKSYDFIGWCNASNYSGCLGAQKRAHYWEENKAVELTIEQFRQMTRKEEIINEYSIF